MRFRLIPFLAGEHRDPRFDESLIDLAAQGGPVASIWTARQGLVVPRTYQRHENFPAASAELAAQGWPVTVRLSGGGVVPQGSGILNVSLAYAFDGPPLRHSDACYQLLCAIIQNALRPWNIETRSQAVADSFCDGRYNLAWGPETAARKIAGTAQLWRHVKLEHGTVQIVLAHALLLAAIDTQEVTERANMLERRLNTGRRYEAARIASLHECRPILQAAAPQIFIRDLALSLSREIETSEAPCTATHPVSRQSRVILP